MEESEQTIVVLSPHCDDAVLSIGGLIAALRRDGRDVVVATVYAGDPQATGPANDWDRHRTDPATGEPVASAGRAARLRQREDADALAELGVSPDAVRHWWGFPEPGQPEFPADPDGAARVAGALQQAIVEVCQGAGLVLAPGLPLAHAAHRAVAEAVVRVQQRLPAVLFYKELPYAASPAKILQECRFGAAGAAVGLLAWTPIALDPLCRLAKRQAVRRYVGELDRLPLGTPRATVLYALFGSEAVGRRPAASLPMAIAVHADRGRTLETLLVQAAALRRRPTVTPRP